MSVFAISFRLDQGPDYARRWESVDAAVRRLSSGPPFDETTSFYVLQANASADTLWNALVTGSELDMRRDALVVLNLSAKDSQFGGTALPDRLNALLAAR